MEPFENTSAATAGEGQAEQPADAGFIATTKATAMMMTTEASTIPTTPYQGDSTMPAAHVEAEDSSGVRDDATEPAASSELFPTRNMAAEPIQIRPWDRAPTMASLAHVKRRSGWLKDCLQRLQNGDTSFLTGADTAHVEHRRMRSEYTKLLAWERIAESQMSQAMGLHDMDLLQGFAPFLEVREPVVALRMVRGKERDILLDSSTGKHYVFERLLHEAGSGTSRRAVWECSAGTVARTNPSSSGSPPQQELFVVKAVSKSPELLQRDPLFYRREFVAQSLVTSFGHPNILPLVSFYESDEILYAVLPKVDASLFDQVNLQYTYTRRGFDCHVVRRVFLQMIRSVEFLTNLGIVHRDLSLENFVVWEEGRVQLIDFGLCHPLPLDPTSLSTKDDELAESRWLPIPASFTGKTFYMSPQIFSAKQQLEQNVDAIAADMWSLGVCLFVLVAGQYPFTVPSIVCERYALFQRHGLTGLISSMIDAGKISKEVRIPHNLLDLMGQLLRIDPTSRPSPMEARMHPFFDS